MDSEDNIVCCGCLSAGRKMTLIIDYWKKQSFMQIISETTLSEGDSIPLWLCWECDAQMNRFTKFKQQVKTSYSLFYDYVKQNTNISKLQPVPRLTAHNLYKISLQDETDQEQFTIVKIEENDQPTSDLATSLENHIENQDTIDTDSENEKLINLKPKNKHINRIILGTKKRKKKRQRRKKIELFKEIELKREELEEERRVAMLKEDYVNAMFRCERCILSFPNAEDLKDHVSAKHEMNSKKLKCDICECFFASEVSYSYHTNKHTRRYECGACAERFKSKRAVLKHYETAHCHGISIEVEKMNEQNGGTTDYTDSKEHNSTYLSSATFSCDYCEKSFRWKASLRKHVETHRIETGQKRKPYCEPCRLSFSNTSNLQKHVKSSSKHQIQLKLRKLTESVPEDSATPEKQQQRIEQIKCSVNSAKERYSCPQCEKKFQWRGNLLRHLRSHVARATGELVCKPCNRTFSSIATYQQHMKISRKHVSENDFKHMCSECGKRFSDKTRLRDHVNWEHLKKYEHICSICQKVFKSHTTLYLHKQVVHNKDSAEHLCDHCGKSFGNQAKLRCHQLAIHSSQTYCCVTCGAKFSWLSCLKRHNNKLHPKTCRLPQDEK